MTDVHPLIASKLEPPIGGMFIVARSRLFRRLNAAVASRLTLLTSPAGWGKTQLLASWIESGSLPLRIGWVTVGQSENDPASLWSYILAALRSAIAPDQAMALRGMSGASASTIDWRVYVAMIANALGELDEPVLLVVDDIDELRAPEVLEQLDFLILHAPNTLRILLSGRARPALSSETMRSVGAVSELRPARMAFTESETGELLRAYELQLDAQDVKNLRDRTDGWITGLQMAVISLKESPHQASMSAIKGTEPLVAEYLFSEVLSNQHPGVQRFLMRTSITSTLTPSLANALTGRTDSHAILRSLEDRGLFTVSNTSNRDEFSYSPVFREFLANHLGAEYGSKVSELQVVASSWFSDQGRVVESIEHAIASGVPATLADIFEKHWLSVYLDGQRATLQRLLDAIEVFGFGRNAEPSAAQALVDLAEGNSHNAIRQLRHLRNLIAKGLAETPGSVSAVTLFTLQYARTTVDVTEAREAWAKLSTFPGIRDVDDADDLLALALLHLGATEFSAGEWKAAEFHLDEALSLARRTNREFIVLGCLSQFAQLATGRNQLSKAGEIAREGLEIANHRGWTHTSESASCWEILAWIHQLRGELDEADVCLDHAEDAVRHDQPTMSAVIHCDLGLILALRGDPGAALAALREAAATLENVQARFVFWTYICAERVRMLSTLGHSHAAHELFSEIAAIEPPPIQVLLARAHMMLDEHLEEEALESLEPALTGFADGPHEDRIQALLMAAVASDRCGRMMQSHKYIRAAIELGRRERLRQPFMRLDPWVAPMLRAFVAHPVTGTISPYVRSILDVLTDENRPNSPAVTDPSSENPQEPLSDRELEVLKLLPDLMTVPELAAVLFISVNTVKAHLKNIYRKLGAPNRRSAVKIARARGLVQ